LSGVIAIAAGYEHNLALKSDGTVVAWGYNANGQTTIPSGLSDVIAIAAGYGHSLALKSDGTVVAWGSNFYGQTTVPSGLSDVTAIAAGHVYSLALKSDGTVVAWGNNQYGQTTLPSGLSGVTAIAAGYSHSLAIVDSMFAVTVTLTVLANPSNKGTTSGSGTYPVGSNQQISVTPNTGWRFVQWQDGNTQNSRTVPIPAGGATYTATLVANTYTVVYNGNGNTGGSTVNSTHTYDTSRNLTPNGFTKTGHEFAGWATSINGSVVYANNASVLNLTPVNGATFNLYAQWTKNATPASHLADPGDLPKTPANVNTVYNGFVYNNNVVQGTLTLTAKAPKKAGAAWTGTAKVVLQTVTLSFSKPTGTVDGFMLTAKSGEMLTVKLGTDTLSGTLSGGRFGSSPLQVAGSRNTFADRKNMAAQHQLNTVRGIYNMALNNEVTAMYKGYVTLNVGNSGAVKIAGKLRDGTAFSGSAKLLAGLNLNGWYCVALHRPLYTKRGFISGLLWIDADRKVRTDTGNNWFVCWTDNSYYSPNHWHIKGGRFGNGTSVPAFPQGMWFNIPEDIWEFDLPQFWTNGRWMTEYLPYDLPVIVSGSKISFPKGTGPRKSGSGYYHVGGNPSLAHISWGPKTGIFKGHFKLYYDRPNSTKADSFNVPYTGVMIPHEGGLKGFGAGTAIIGREKVAIPVEITK